MSRRDYERVGVGRARESAIYSIRPVYRRTRPKIAASER